VAAPPPSRRIRTGVERYVVAHVAAYPIAFVWALGSIPLAILLSFRDLEALNDDLPAIGQLIVRRVAWPAGVAFALPHLIAIPWAFGRERARQGRAAWMGIAGVGAAGVLVGAASWLWLFLR
jgi:hypothetical protein